MPKQLKCLVLSMLITTTLWASTEDYVIPNNKYLADSVWPIVHANNYAQDSSSLRGPTEQDTLKIDFVSLMRSEKQKHFFMDPIGLLYSGDGKTMWGSSFTSIFRVDRSGKALKIISQLDASKIDTLRNYHMHGAYSLLAKVNNQERFIIAKRNSVSAYATDGSNNSIKNVNNRIIKHINKEDTIVGLNVTYDGWLIYVTKKGKVGAISLDFATDTPPLQLPGGNNLDVSNSFALDAEGGIYIVSNEYMQRINWDASNQKLQLAWNTAYDSGGSIPEPGRLGTGSGSTPSLMGDSKDGFYVVITDGAKLMNLNVFDAVTGQLVANAPVNFGDPAVKSSTSEQSVLVSGWRMVVVNNQYHSSRPILEGEAPMGVQQFIFNKESKELTETWHLNNVSVPNGIPTMSQKTQMMYAIAKKQTANSDKVSGWGLVGIDWHTGKEMFFEEAGQGLRYNSSYAATEVGLDGEIISGTALGVLRFRPVMEIES